jgi:transcription-repair coupling factor (superfamily II helicase)
MPDLEAIAEELTDRYGPPPPVVDTLLRVMELRRWLKDLRIVRARRRGAEVSLEFDPSTPVSAERLAAAVREQRGRLRLASGTVLLVAPAAVDQDGLVAELREHLRMLAGAC